MSITSDQSYVRTEMLAEKAPPSTNVGIIGWMRANLFSSWLNVILSLLAIYAIYSTLAYILPWIFGGVWNATSLTECRIVITEAIGDSHGAGRACWAVIHERFWQLMYGFYPSDQYWRPNLALIMLFVAIAPVLFNGLPKKMLLISVAFPFVAPWLLWGGAIWTPLMAFMGFVIGYFVHKFASKIAGPLVGIILGTVSALLWWLLFSSAVSHGISHMIGASRMSGEIARLETSIPLQEAEIVRHQAIVDPLAEQVLAIQEKIDAAVSAKEPVADLIRTKTPLYLTLGSASSDLSKEKDTLNVMKSRLNAIKALPQEEARSLQLAAEANAARTALPESVADLTDIMAVELGVSGEDKDQLEAVLKVEGERDSLQSKIEMLYQDVGLVGLVPVKSRDFGGLMLAVLLGITGIGLSFPLGIVLALGRLSDLMIVKALCVGFIEFIRGVPLITLLFVASVLLNYFLPKGTEFDIILRVMIMITIFAAAYMAEVIRGGLAALPKGQYEAADALGLDYWQAQRLIIMPQALKISIPGIVSTFIGLFKDTTLVSIIALLDILGWAKTIQATSDWNGVIWELYGFIAFVFFIFCFSMSRYSMYLERKLQTGH